MAQEFAKAFYNSTAWKKCRASYIASVYHQCERCANGTIGYIVHHKILLTQHNIDDPTVTLNHDNLEYLCQDCHNREHNSGQTVANGLVFDGNGQLVRL
jgi:5-methylcytosine-specific restriction protein A